MEEDKNNGISYSSFACCYYTGGLVILCQQKQTRGTSRSSPLSLFFRRPNDCYGLTDVLV